MIVDEKLHDMDVSDDEIDEDPPQDDVSFGARLSDQETKRRVKKLIERWRGRGTPVAKAYAYELEMSLK